MTVILKWNYVYGSDFTLDAIAMNDAGSVDDLAVVLGLSKRTTERRLSSLKKSGRLVIHRYADNNFIWMIGDDASKCWSAHDAYEIAVHRDALKRGFMTEELVSDLSEEDLSEMYGEYRLFEITSPVVDKPEFVHMPSGAQSLMFTEFEKTEIEDAIDKLGY